MKTKVTSAILSVCFLFSLVPAFAGTTPAAGPTSRTTKVFKHVLKTDHLRIMSLDLKPGEHLDFHASPEQEAYAGSDGTLRMVTPDGEEKIVNVKAGDRLWTDLTQFKNWNTGEKTIKILLLEQPREVLEKKSTISFYSLKP
ncbi:hypothetical protein ACFSC6_15810 [Rufibacter sediminis]|uniref:Cupin 2 conserved barrel domain-containing protein n=1 Tax=Rufibacter sediminis TaxID=2762756 RepID=A0ABR6VWE6_9BACT|nr:hypothetical protein [Rufibacter sediminis]MBC3541502.1 hypothetical protein [Rufibacter sediminis]